jgi:soluble lytic murein transglycosylase
VTRYEGDVELALAAYNAGSEVVDKWARRYPVKNRLLFLDLIPYAETRNYVTLIGRNYYWYSKLYAELLNTEGLAKIEPNEFRSMKSVEQPVTP